MQRNILESPWYTAGDRYSRIVLQYRCGCTGLAPAIHEFVVRTQSTNNPHAFPCGTDSRTGVYFDVFDYQTPSDALREAEGVYFARLFQLKNTEQEVKV